ncbi:MAG: response regulator [Candidatus Eremiobacteraeota bacterium]|nr:response regulator [Candidatus Eremiobacteraeota bacterium]
MQSAGSGKAILVVDDEPINRELLRAVLASEHHDVFLAEDGEQALELVRSRRPDLIIVDLHLPGMTGTEFIKRVRRGEADSETVIALYTASDITAAMRDFMQLMNVELVIPKPADPEQIIAIVRKALY